MNKFYDIIPTPQKMENRGTDIFNIKNVDVMGNITGKTEYALSMLKKETSFEMATGAEDALVICLPAENAPEGVFEKDDLAIFDMPNAKEQGYVIKKKNGTTYIGAMGEMGVVYAIMTLLQLLGKPVGDFVRRT